MKDQQRDFQESRGQQKNSGQERRPDVHARPAQLPARQWAQLLRQGDKVLELPAPLLGQLAEAVGNSSLAALLRQGGGGGPATHLADTLVWEGQGQEVNHIRTAPPALHPFAGWPERGGAWPRPVKPGGIRDRG